jgi:signal peptidase
MDTLISDGGVVVLETAPRRRRGFVHGFLHWCGQVLAWLVMLGIGAMLLVALLVPRLAGATTYVIETGSMRPDLPPGTMVAVKPVDPATIATGDVITYQLRSGDATVVTHRVVSIGYDGTGAVRWRTQGDANGTADQNWVMPEQVKGTLWYSVPYLGHVTALASTQQRGLLVGLIALGLGGYAVVQLRGAWAERRCKGAGDVS